MNYLTIFFFGFLICKLNFWQFLTYRTMAKVKRVYKCKDLRTMEDTTNISHYFHWKLHMYIAIAFICIICMHYMYAYAYILHMYISIGIFLFFLHETACLVLQLIFFSQQISWRYLYQPPFKLFWMDMSWMQPLRMDVSCSSVDGQGSFHFFFSIMKLQWTPLCVTSFGHKWVFL